MGGLFARVGLFARAGLVELASRPVANVVIQG